MRFPGECVCNFHDTQSKNTAEDLVRYPQDRKVKTRERPDHENQKFADFISRSDYR